MVVLTALSKRISRKPETYKDAWHTARTFGFKVDVEISKALEHDDIDLTKLADALNESASIKMKKKPASTTFNHI